MPHSPFYFMISPFGCLVGILNTMPKFWIFTLPPQPILSKSYILIKSSLVTSTLSPKLGSHFQFLPFPRLISKFCCFDFQKTYSESSFFFPASLLQLWNKSSAFLSGLLQQCSLYLFFLLPRQSGSGVCASNHCHGLPLVCFSLHLE